MGQDNRASQITENSAYYLLEQILPGIREGCTSMKNKKSKCIAIIFLLLPLISLPPVLAQAADSSPKWDQPFDKPMYLLHTMEAKYYDSNWEDFGTLTEELWILDPNNNGFIEMPNPYSPGMIVRYSIDQTMGPYDTHREVCAVTEAAASSSALKYPKIIQGGHFVLFNCKDIPAQPEKPDKPEEEFLVVTRQGTTAVKPGEEGQIKLSPGEIAEIDAKCQAMKDVIILMHIEAQKDSNTIASMYATGYAFATVISLVDIACESLKSGKPIKLHKTAEFADISSSSDYPVKLEFSLQSGSLRMETVHDQVALDVKTPTMTVSSEGKNTFGVAYDPNSGSSSLSAYQNPIHIQPSNSNLAPFTLRAGQQVEVSSEGIGSVTPMSQTPGGAQGSTYVSPDGRDIYGPAGGAGNAAGQTGVTSGVPQGGCYTDPSTGEMICVDRIGDFFNPEAGNQEQGGCYADPMSGEVICVDAFGEITNPSSSMVTTYTSQPDAGSSVPQSLQECETYTSEICGTWTRMGDQFNAQWDNSASATLKVERWDNGAVVLTRHDTGGSSAGLSARYEGRCTGNHVEGTVTWTWNGSTWSGTWSADW